MPPDSPKWRPHHRHSERRGAKQSEAPRIEEPILQRRAATPLMQLRHGVRCLVEVLFKRVPPLRAFGPSVGMTAKGGLQNRRVGCAARGMGFATEDTEGTEGIRPQVGSVVSVILCGLPCPYVLFILSMPVRRVAATEPEG